jgi:hypothetical protein
LIKECDFDGSESAGGICGRNDPGERDRCRPQPGPFAARRQQGHRRTGSRAGLRLFDRNGPRVTPTAKAFLLYEEVERSLVGLRSIRERAQEIAREEVHPVHLVATPALASTIAPAALQLLAADKERAFPNTSTCAALRPSRWCMRSCIAPSAWG